MEGLTFYVMTESGLQGQQKKTKLELEALVKNNGGRIVQTHTAVADPICVAARRTVPVASLQKRGEREIVKPIWIFDCIEQGRRDFAQGREEMVVPFEAERHFFFVPEKLEGKWDGNVDEYGDSFARDTSVEELEECMAKMADVREEEPEDLVSDMFPEFMSMRGFMFRGLTIYIDHPNGRNSKPLRQNGSSAVKHTSELELGPETVTSIDLVIRSTLSFGGAKIVDISSLEHQNKAIETITHIVAYSNSDLKSIRKCVSEWPGQRIPRIVSAEWVDACWREGTRVDEEAYVPGNPR